MIVMVRGKWQMRIVNTLREAQHALTIRQIRIRIGVTSEKDPYGTKIRNVLYHLARTGVLVRIGRGMYRL